MVPELLRHASFRTTMDGYTQALDEPKLQALERMADVIMAPVRSVAHDCCEEFVERMPVSLVSY